MALYDMPKEKLFEYTGSTPKPKDFEKFWSDALAELATFDPQPEFVPSEDFSCKSADCYHIFFTGTKGARVHAKYVKPKNVNGKMPAVVAFHGYNSRSGSWNRNLKFTAEGIAVARLDCRGQTPFSDDTASYKGLTAYNHFVRGLGDENPHNLYYRDVFLDAVLLTRIISSLPDVDENRICVMGGSQGAALSIAAAALVPQVKLAVLQYPYLCDYKRVWALERTDAYTGLREFFHDCDPLHEKEDEIFNRLGYIDVQNFAPMINAEVVMASGLSDTVCPPSTHFAFYNKVKSKKQVLVFPEYGHVYLNGWEDIAFKKILEL